MFVKIIKCSSDKFWYKDKIGAMIEVDYNYNNYMTSDRLDESKNYGIINFEDCEVINDEIEKEEMVTITKVEYENLLDYSNKLSCLEACGVDNWCGWDDAMQMYREEVE